MPLARIHFFMHIANIQRKRVCFRNTSNAMLQAAFWRVIYMFQIQDVDVLELIYDSAKTTNDAETSNITFNSLV